ncbi:hypothetical protein [Halocatena salina]|uniref:Uncharacterized protein n=1 Tax=Halocatena salina TaxID=2934340 RepID=A0A8U0A5K0_9EURY|nr:hypothetical protein [Halocatena salina]UPM43187.1 hypothetical protein MW046_01765 [Halocatena salina]
MTAPTSVGIDPKPNELSAANDGSVIYTTLPSLGFESFGKRTGAEGARSGDEWIPLVAVTRTISGILNRWVLSVVAG